MRKPPRAAVWVRQTASLVTALSLVLHISLMAFGTAPRPTVKRDVGAQDLHHADAATASHSSEPKKAEKHPQACCILSYLQGLPPPSDGVWLLPHTISAILAFKEGFAPGPIRFSLPYPVGARAPPALAWSQLTINFQKTGQNHDDYSCTRGACRLRTHLARLWDPSPYDP